MGRTGHGGLSYPPCLHAILKCTQIYPCEHQLVQSDGVAWAGGVPPYTVAGVPDGGHAPARSLRSLMHACWGRMHVARACMPLHSDKNNCMHACILHILMSECWEIFAVVWSPQTQIFISLSDTKPVEMVVRLDVGPSSLPKVYCKPELKNNVPATPGKYGHASHLDTPMPQ